MLFLFDKERIILLSVYIEVMYSKSFLSLIVVLSIGENVPIGLLVVRSYIEKYVSVSELFTSIKQMMNEVLIMN